MAIRKIARMGHPILKVVATPIDEPTSEYMKRLAAISSIPVKTSVAMVSLRHRFTAASDVRLQGQNEVMPEGVKMQSIPWTVCINPVIEPLSEETKLYWERCLSLPGLYGQVPRYRHIRFTWTDLDGVTHSQRSSGFHARLLQHEYDHLDGFLYPMRMVDAGTLGYVSELGPAAYPPIPRDASDFIDPQPD